MKELDDIKGAIVDADLKHYTDQLLELIGGLSK